MTSLISITRTNVAIYRPPHINTFSVDCSSFLRTQHIRPLIYPFIHPFIHPSICISVCPSLKVNSLINCLIWQLQIDSCSFTFGLFNAVQLNVQSTVRVIFHGFDELWFKDWKLDGSRFDYLFIRQYLFDWSVNLNKAITARFGLTSERSCYQDSWIEHFRPVCTRLSVLTPQ